MIFKMDWEKAHTKVQLSDELIMKMLATYYDKSDIKSVAIIDGGCVNLNILVHLQGSSEPVVLRVYLRDKENAYRESAISSMVRNKLPVPTIYHIAEGFGHTFAIAEYLKGKPLSEFLVSSPTQDDISHVMFKIGKTLGEISGFKFSSSGFFTKNLSVQSDVSPSGLVAYCHDCLDDLNVSAVISEQQKKYIARLFETHCALLPNGSECCLVHADYDPANILVTENGGEIEISGVLDWEFSFSGSTLFDVASMLRYAHQMPQAYQTSFLEGLASSGYELPDGWQHTTYLLNILALLDCIRRSYPSANPNRILDTRLLVSYFLSFFSES